MPRISEEQKIRHLEAQIESLKAKVAAKMVKRDPSQRFISAAVRHVAAALAATEDSSTRKALDEARATLGAVLALSGGVMVPQLRRSAAQLDEAVVLAYVQAHSGARGEDVAAGLGTDTQTLRPVMHRLIEQRMVKTAGRARGMTYAAV